MNRSLMRYAVASAVALLFSIGLGHTQDFPTRPVTLIVPFAAGGTIGHRTSRAGLPRLRNIPGKSIVIENRTGVPAR